MSAESTKEQEQLRIKDNETMQQEQGTNLTKPCKVDSPNSISSKSTESIDNHVDVASECVQLSISKVSCQADEQISQILKNPVAIENGSISEQESFNNKVDNLLNDENKSSMISQTSIAKDISDTSRPNAVTELSDDYLMQMLNNLNDRRIALDEGVFFDADQQNHLPLQEASISNESDKADNNENLDKLELTLENNDDENNDEEKSCLKEETIIIDSHTDKDDEKGPIDEYKTENNGDTEEESCLKEKSMEIDSHCEENNEKEPIDENITDESDLLPSKELLIVDESNHSNDIVEVEEKSSIEKSHEPVKLADSGDGNQFDDKNTSVVMLENIDLKKAFTHTKFRNTSNEESDIIIDNIQHMKWLKPTVQENTGVNKRRMARRFSIETEECNEDIKDELIDDTKINSKKKRSNQRKNLKTKAADSLKPDNKEDMITKSSEDIGSIDTSRSYGRGGERSKDTKATQLPTSQRIGIGRGRGDRRKVSLGNSQPRGQIDINDQRNRSQKSSEEKLPTTVEKSFNKSEAHSKAQGSSKKVEIVEEFTENIAVSTELTKQKEQEVHETKSNFKSDIVPLMESLVDGPFTVVQSSRNQSSVKSTSESSIKENQGKIDTKKDQSKIDTKEDHQQSQNKSITNLASSRPIYGRSTDKSNCEKVISSVRGFGQNTDEVIKSNKPSQSLSSKDNVYRSSEQANRNQQENKAYQSYSSVSKGKEESYSNKYTNSSNTCDQDAPRWNFNNQPDKQNVKRDEMVSNKSHTSNKHRNVADERRETEESFGKNQAFADKSEGSRRHSDKFQDTRYSAGRYSERHQDNKVHDKYSDKNQDDKNYGERYSTKNEDGKSYRDTDTDRSQVGRRDTHFDNNRRNRGFGEKYSDFNQDRHYGNNYSNKFRDGKSSSDRYSDNQQSKTFDGRFYSEKHDENEIVTKKEESSIKNTASSDANKNCSDNNHTASKSPDSPNKIQRLPGKNNEDRHYGNDYSNKFRDGKSSSDRYSDNHQSKTSDGRFYSKKHDENEIVTKKEESSIKSTVSSDASINCSDNNHTASKSSDSPNKIQRPPGKNNESPNSAKLTYNKSHPTYEVVNENYSEKNYQPFNLDNNYRNQDASNNFAVEYNERTLCPEHRQAQLERFKNNFWQPPDQTDLSKEKQYKSDVKSQKHFDNTQQAKVQMGLSQVQQTQSRSPVACQQELSPAVDQTFEMNGRITPMTGTIKSQPSQGDTWSSYKNTSNQDIVYSSDFQNASPYSNLNIAFNPAVTNEYNLQYNQAHLDTSNQYNSALAPGQKPNVVMTFEGNQNVQRALGMDPRIVNQMNSSDSSLSNTTSPDPPQPIYANENVAQFFQSATADSHTTLSCVHSTMNVNAQPFEVPKQSNQESNKHQMYAMQSTVSNHGQSGLGSPDNDFVLDLARKNTKSNDYEEYLSLRKEIYEISQQLALKQGQLLALEMKWFKNTSAADKTGLNVINQQSNPPIQHTNNNQLVQETNQILSSSYGQVKSSNCPPGFADVSMDRQSAQAQLNLYKMLTSVSNVQHYTTDSLPSNNVAESKSNAQAVYLAQGNMFQQQTATYQMYTDKTANSATYMNMMPQRTEQRQIRGANQFSK